ncbi:hypothetical protein [Streptomonospora nanhaiensis]|uniref:NAD(P)-dependent dehydrogenase (Short-subunit alcohol dehydrogenase family) n=1 Tax=Streptomonospora nanhaiensis TaxID=1323731 RepID=A0A853BTB5_9ACTN|nr:hypothetical protein [Streptomonospora nanhaiensis]MBV2364929.1 hypothetical protein [Streptomonospora nanhaiensis]NYI97552.1 NAD(P)-dependent dehydrogenase (short-subunit alcohol dehydrogenase family) [Streptomonospora nanhaiensis]
MIARPPRRRPPVPHRRAGPRADSRDPADPLPGYTGTGRLADRRALVVGGVTEGGPGAAVAAALAKEGAAAVAVADRAPGGHREAGAVPAAGAGDGPLADLARVLASLGAWALPIHCDPRAERDVRAAAAHTLLEFGAVDVVVVCESPPAPPAGPAPAPRAAVWDSLLSGGLRLVRGVRGLLGEGASAVVLAEPGPARPAGAEAGAGTAITVNGGVRAAAAPLAAALRRRGVRLTGLLAGRRDSDAEVAAAVVRLAAGAARTGDVLDVAQVLGAPA